MNDKMKSAGATFTYARYFTFSLRKIAVLVCFYGIVGNQVF